jgi:GT2 family glycosyltransferase
VEFSICIPTYRGAARLARLFESLPRNLDAEVLVWDDGSPPQDASAIERVVPANAQVRHSLRNRGAVAALEEMASLAAGRFILQLDDDVRLPPGFFEAARQLLALPNIGVLSWRSCGIDEDRPGVAGLLEPATELAGYCMTYPTELRDAIGGIDTRYKMYCSDSDFTLRAMMSGRPCYRVGWPLVPHEEHGVYKDPDNEGLRRTRDEVAPLDMKAFVDKWGADGQEMQRRAIARLMGG